MFGMIDYFTQYPQQLTHQIVAVYKAPLPRRAADYDGQSDPTKVMHQTIVTTRQTTECHNALVTKLRFAHYQIADNASLGKLSRLNDT